MTDAPSSAGLARQAVPADDEPLAVKVPAPPPLTLFDAAPAMYAVDLAHETMPDWLAAAGEADHRWARGPSARPYSWRIYARAALDYSGLPIVPRTILRVVLDRHTDDDRTAAMPASTIAARAGIAARESVQRAWPELVATGWLLVVGQRGRTPTLTLMCPVDQPPDNLRKPKPGVTEDHTPPVTEDHTGVTVGHTGCDRGSHRFGDRRSGDQPGDTRSSSRDAIAQGAVDSPQPADVPWSVWTPTNDPRIGRWK